jgi:tetratricopeptide (TPR) repeat protein
VLGYIYLVVDRDVEAAHAAVERALQLNPGSFRVQRAWSNHQGIVGHREAAIAAAQKGVALDPIAPDAHVNLSSTLLFARRYVDAEAAARRALALDAARSAAHAALGLALLMQQRTDEALAAFDKESIAWQRMVGRASVFAVEGKRELARQELAAMRERFGDGAAYQYAEVNALLGDRDEAMRWLGVARRVRDPGLMQMHADPTLDNLRPDPRFQALERELGLREKT